jgi:UDPglucose 6-dehydrogenase
MKISVFGAGYVGLVSAACLAEVGHHVMCVDIDPAKIDKLHNGIIPIWEPGLEPLVLRNAKGGRLQFTTDVPSAVAFGQVQVIAVGTPSDEDGSADMQYVLAVAREIASHMVDYKVIVNKSTVPVGTADEVQLLVRQVLADRGEMLDFDVVSNPEFLKEGAAVNDFLKPDRIIIGSDSERAKAIMRELYEPFNRNHERTIFMDIRSAELTKYAANAMLATKISFMNEMANLAERLGADIEQVRKGIGSDPRIGTTLFTVTVEAVLSIYPGCGGGQPIPKGLETGGLAVCATKPLPGDFLSRCQAPSRHWQHGAGVQAYDPIAMVEAARIYEERVGRVGLQDEAKLPDFAEMGLRGGVRQPIPKRGSVSRVRHQIGRIAEFSDAVRVKSTS